MRIFTLLTTALLLATPIAQAQNDPIQLRQQVVSTAEDYVRSHIDGATGANDELVISSSPLDDRIQVPACPEPFIASSSPGAMDKSKITVRVTCEPSNWYVYTMVDVALMQNVVVAASIISPGTVITEQHVRVEKIDKQRLRNSTYADIDKVLGARIKRRVRDGQPITLRLLCYVCEGDSISIEADLGGLQVKTSGIAQEDGNIGDTIMVKNSKSKKLVDAVVTSASAVKVNI